MPTYIYQPSSHPSEVLSDWLGSKGTEISSISAIQYHLFGRVALLGVAAVASIHAAGCTLIANFAQLLVRQPSPFIQNEMKKANHSLSVSLSCLRSMMSPQSLENRLTLSAPTPKEYYGTVPSKLRQFRIKRGHKLIQERMRKQYNLAQTQARNEPDKAFQYLSAPPIFPQSHTTNIDGYEVGVSHFIGRRETMEDTHLATSFSLNIQGKVYPVQLFGIFDGHGDRTASDFVSAQLKRELQRTLREFSTEGFSDAIIWNALKITCAKLNAKYQGRGGTTATFAMILNNKLWTANVGDARTIVDNGVQLTLDAKPSDPYFQKGIRNMGGIVINVQGVDRVGGRIAVARAIGDHEVKGMIARSKIIGRPLSEFPKGSHLILTCDGIFDVASTRQVAQAVRTNRHQSAKDLARNIVYSAFAANSTDNLSALVVKL